METNTNPFYELRSGLYASAAAGCSMIAEDFRFKRALKNFESFSKKSKAFEKFYSMCSELISSEEPQKKISDCLAFADALSVAQGTFQDNSEKKQFSYAQNIPLSSISYKNIEKCKNALRELRKTKEKEYIKGLDSPIFIKMAHDPRMLSVYMEICGCGGKWGCKEDEITDFFESIYGKMLIPALEMSIDLESKNSSGKEITHIFRIAGTAENDLYAKYASDEKVPINVRIKAVEALSCLEDNEEILYNIFNTSRGKLKKAALKALARINSELAVPALEKAFSKFSSDNIEYAAVSGLPVCSEYARNAFEKSFRSSSDGSEQHSYIDCIRMLANKKDVNDCIEKAVKSGKCPPHIFIENICGHDDEEYRSFIKYLYEKYDNSFTATLRFILGLIETPQEIVSIMGDNIWKYNTVFIRLLAENNGMCFYPDGKYYLKFSGLKIPVFESMPDSLLDFIAYTGDIFDAGKAMKQKLSRSETEAAMEHTSRKTAFLESLKTNCPDCDREKIKEAVEKYAAVLRESLINTFNDVVGGVHRRNNNSK